MDYPDYPASGLQAINTQTFVHVFRHKPGSRDWGWEPNYIESLKEKLHKQKKIPAFDLVVWLYRDKEWPNEKNPDKVIEYFFNDFNINEQEKHALFDLTAPDPPAFADAFQSAPPTWREVLNELKSRMRILSAPDVQPDQGGTLAYLETRRLGPAEIFEFAPAKRLNLITGDNGLGKTFLLETAWWVLTGTWAEQPLYPGQERLLMHEKAPPAEKGIRSNFIQN